MISLIDGEKLKQLIFSAANNLENNKKMLNDLNVFPVPDGDTGTNMCLTFINASKAVENSAADKVGEVAEVLANSSLRNARGNSGVILSQLVRGMSKALKGIDAIGIEEMVNAFKGASDTAYKAVMKPTEGTILTVARETAEFAEASGEQYSDVVSFFKDTVKSARESLDRTPEILPVLKQANVVDAGGMGFLVLLEGMLYALENGCVMPRNDNIESTPVTEGRASSASENIKFLYCTEFIINKKEQRSAKQFKAAISEKGDSVLVIEDDAIVKVHIHTNNPGFVIEQAIKIGELCDIKIDNMKMQHDEILSAKEDAGKEVQTKEPPKQYGFVAVAAGEGMTQIFRDMQVDIVVEGGQTMNPSTQDILNAVEHVNAENVFVLPNNKNIILAAQQAAEISSKNVFVIPAKNIPQGISAMLAFDYDKEASLNEAEMKSVIEFVKSGQVTFAARDSVYDGKEIKQGDILGMEGSSIQLIGKDKKEVCIGLLDGLMDEAHSVISVFYGEDVTEAEAEEMRAEIEGKYPNFDIIIHCGGQPLYYYIISLE